MKQKPPIIEAVKQNNLALYLRQIMAETGESRPPAHIGRTMNNTFWVSDKL
jgi:hypothetical protein